MGKYDADMAKYIPGLVDLAIQGMLDDIDTREKVAQPSYRDKEQLDFSNSIDRKLLCKSSQHPYLFSY